MKDSPHFLPVSDQQGNATSDAPLPAPPTRKGKATRQRLLEAAEAEIGEQGFHGASINGITTRAKVGQGTFYLYFRSKEDVLRELVQHLGREVRHRLSESAAQATSRMDAERLGMEAFLQFVCERPDLYRVLMEAQSVDLDVYQRYYLDFANGYMKVLEQAAAEGEIVPGNALARAWSIMGLNHFLGMRWPLWEGKAPPKEILDAVVDLLSNGMTPRD